MTIVEQLEVDLSRRLKRNVTTYWDKQMLRLVVEVGGADSIPVSFEVLSSVPPPILLDQLESRFKDRSEEATVTSVSTSKRVNRRQHERRQPGLLGCACLCRSARLATARKETGLKIERGSVAAHCRTEL